VFSEYVDAVRAALAATDFARAHELATHATRLFPQSRRAWTHLAAARVRLAQWGPAIEAARQAEKARADDDAPPALPSETQAGAAYWEGVALYSTQRYDEALVRLRAARAIAPRWAEAARALAECTFVAGKSAAAAADYAAAFALDPGVLTVRDLSYYAEAQAAAGDIAGGIAAIQEALRRAPYEPGLHAKLGDLLRRESRLADAFYELVYEVVLHGLESPFARSAVTMQDELVKAVRAEHGEHARAEGAAADTHAARTEADAHEILAVASGLRSIDTGATHRAARHFEHALAGTRSTSPMPHLLYADALLRDGQADDARRVLGLLLESQPECVPALFMLADTERAQGRPAEAEAALARARALYPRYWRLAAKPNQG
jgi:tetratricopeptide (TPR) repeat protein